MSYIDQKAYLTNEFSLFETANNLVKSTATAQDIIVDLQPSINRLGYDIEEIDKAIAEVARDNTSELLEHAETLQKVRDSVSELDTDVANANAVYSKLQRDFIKPYERIKEVYNASTKLHNTASLLRSLSWYLHLAVEIVVNADENPSAESVYESAQYLKELAELLHDTPSLRSVDLVRTHEQTLASVTNQLLGSAGQIVRDFYGDRSALKFAVLTLNLLDGSLAIPVNAYHKAQISSSILQLSRTAGSSVTSFESAFRDVLQKGANIEAMQATLVENLAGEAVDGLAPSTLVADYWQQVSSGLDQKLKTMTVANQVMARAMNQNGSKILSVTESSKPVYDIFSKYLKRTVESN